MYVCEIFFMKLVSSTLVGFQEGRRIYNKSTYMKKRRKENYTQEYRLQEV